MQFCFILAIVLAIGISQNGATTPVENAAARAGLTGLGIALISLIAVTIASTTAARLRRNFAGRADIMRRFDRLQNVHIVLWLTVSMGSLAGLGWGRVVRFNWNLERAFLVDDLLILTPVLLPMLLSWAAFHKVDLALRIGATGSGSATTQAASRLRYVAVHARHYLGVVLAPVLLLLAVQDGAELVMPGILESDRALWVQAPALLLLVALFPLLLRHLWNSHPLVEGPLRERLSAAAARCGVSVREILVLDTNGLSLNAAVTGFLPGTRYVYLTDALLTELTEDEIEATFAHELGHIRHHHMPFRLLVTVVPLTLLLGATTVWPELSLGLWTLLERTGMDAGLLLGVLSVLLMSFYMWFVFGPYSRILEGQADWHGCLSLGRTTQEESLQTFLSALSKLDQNSPRSGRRASWQHAGVAQRSTLLERLTDDPGFQHRFQRRIQWTNRLIAASVVIPLLIWVSLG